MARSSGLPVCFRSPSECIRCVATTRTPLPTSRPAGARVVAPVGEPAGRSCWYMRSWNSARAFLNPAVDTLAMLLAVTSRRVSCASMPVAAVDRALIIETSVRLAAAGRDVAPAHSRQRATTRLIRPPLASLAASSDRRRRPLIDLLVALDHPVQRLVASRDLDHV